MFTPGTGSTEIPEEEDLFTPKRRLLDRVGEQDDFAEEGTAVSGSILEQIAKLQVCA